MDGGSLETAVNHFPVGWRIARQIFYGLSSDDRESRRQLLKQRSIGRKEHRRRLRRRNAEHLATMLPSDIQARQRDALFARISAQVPRYIDAALRDDIIMDVYLAALEEEINGRRQAEGDGEAGDFDK